MSTPHDDPSPLRGEALVDRIDQHYPAPIAVPFRALTEQEAGAGAFGSLLDTFEGLVHFLALVTISAYHRRGLDEPRCNRQLAERFLKGPWSVGDYLALLRDTLRLAGPGDWHPYSQLFGYLFDEDRPSESARALESFVSLRNRLWGHGTGRTDAVFAEALPAHRQRLEDELARMPWLTDWDLVRPLAVEPTGAVRSAQRLMGSRRGRAWAGALALDAADLDVNGGPVRPGTALLLVAPGGSRYLPLFPQALFQVTRDRRDGVFLLQACQWRRGEVPRRLQRAVYLAYADRPAEHEERAEDAAARQSASAPMPTAATSPTCATSSSAPWRRFATAPGEPWSSSTPSTSWPPATRAGRRPP